MNVKINCSFCNRKIDIKTNHFEDMYCKCGHYLRIGFKTNTEYITVDDKEYSREEHTPFVMNLLECKCCKTPLTRYNYVCKKCGSKTLYRIDQGTYDEEFKFIHKNIRYCISFMEGSTTLYNLLIVCLNKVPVDWCSGDYQHVERNKIIDKIYELVKSDKEVEK